MRGSSGVRRQEAASRAARCASMATAPRGRRAGGQRAQPTAREPTRSASGRGWGRPVGRKRRDFPAAGGRTRPPGRRRAAARLRAGAGLDPPAPAGTAWRGGSARPGPAPSGSREPPRLLPERERRGPAPGAGQSVMLAWAGARAGSTAPLARVTAAGQLEGAIPPGRAHIVLPPQITEVSSPILEFVLLINYRKRVGQEQQEYPLTSRGREALMNFYCSELQTFLGKETSHTAAVLSLVKNWKFVMMGKENFNQSYYLN